MPIWKTNSLGRSFRCAFAGIHDVIKIGRNAKIQLAIAAIVAATGFLLSLSQTDWAILSLTIGIVIAAESANTAIEVAVDLASPEHHELARRSKDAAAGAVLVTALIAIVVGGLVLGPPLYEVIRQFTPHALKSATTFVRPAALVAMDLSPTAQRHQYGLPE